MAVRVYVSCDSFLSKYYHRIAAIDAVIIEPMYFRSDAISSLTLISLHSCSNYLQTSVQFFFTLLHNLNFLTLSDLIFYLIRDRSVFFRNSLPNHRKYKNFPYI